MQYFRLLVLDIYNFSIKFSKNIKVFKNYAVIYNIGSMQFQKNEQNAPFERRLM